MLAVSGKIARVHTPLTPHAATRARDSPAVCRPGLAWLSNQIKANRPNRTEAGGGVGQLLRQAPVHAPQHGEPKLPPCLFPPRQQTAVGLAYLASVSRFLSVRLFPLDAMGTSRTQRHTCRTRLDGSWVCGASWSAAL